MAFWAAAVPMFLGAAAAVKGASRDTPKPPAYGRTYNPYLRAMSPHLQTMDWNYYRAIRDMNRQPLGLSAEERFDIEGRPIAAQRRGERSSISALNKSAAAAQGFGSGSRVRAEGRIRSEGMRQRGDIRTGAAATAARFAREDRYARLREMARYTEPRAQLSVADTASQRAAQTAINRLLYGQYGMALQRHDASRERWFDIAGDLFGAGMGAMGGGKGPSTGGGTVRV